MAGRGGGGQGKLRGQGEECLHARECSTFGAKNQVRACTQAQVCASVREPQLSSSPRVRSAHLVPLTCCSTFSLASSVPPPSNFFELMPLRLLTTFHGRVEQWTSQSTQAAAQRAASARNVHGSMHTMQLSEGLSLLHGKEQEAEEQSRACD